jgi:hypothetical protein
VLSAAHDAGVPEPDLARQEARLCAKLARLVQLSAAQSDALCAGALGLAQLGDVRELSRLIAACA